MKTYVIFDLDGTLLNTIDDLAQATNYALRELGFPQHGLWIYPNMVGNGVGRLMERALPDDARSEKNVKDMLAVFKSYYDEHCCDATKPYPGISEMLEEFTSRGVNLAVTSNKYQEAVTKIIGHYFPTANFKAVLGMRRAFLASRIRRLCSRRFRCVPRQRRKCCMLEIPAWIWKQPGVPAWSLWA